MTKAVPSGDCLRQRLPEGRDMQTTPGEHRQRGDDEQEEEEEPDALLQPRRDVIDERPNAVDKEPEDPGETDRAEE